MLQNNIARYLWLVFLGTLPSVVYAQDFSADLIDLTSKPASTVAKVYAKGDKLRVDRGDLKGDAAGPAVIVDGASHTVIILDVSTHTYLKSEMGDAAGTPLFRLPDVNNACPDLDKLAGMQGSCRKIGSETVNGRATIKYEGKSEDGAQILMWGDPEVKYVVKWQGKSGEAGEIRNIKVSPQASNLFDLPAGYRNAGGNGGEGTTDQK
jgi:hypothetical protein